MEENVTRATVAFSAEETARVALCVGEALLHFGGDVHRVEDSMTRVINAYGAQKADVFVIPSLIQVQVIMPDGSEHQLISRVTHTYLHLARLEKINDICRKICAEPQPYSVVEGRIAQAKKLHPIPEWLRCIGGFLATASFTLFFGGNWLDGLCSGVIGLFIAVAERFVIPKMKINELGATAITSFFAGLLSVLSVVAGIGEHVDLIIIGTIMLEIPGIALGNAARDMLTGDIISGSLGTVRSILRALVMALFYIAALTVGSFISGGLMI